MSKQSWLPLFVAILPTPIGYLINQLPGIPDFPYKERVIWAGVLMLTAIGAYWVWQQGRSTEVPIASLESGRRMRLIQSQVEVVKKRLEDALARSAMIPLDLKDASSNVGQSPLKDLQVAPIVAPAKGIFDRAKKFLAFGKGPDMELPPQMKMIDVFHRHDVSGRLLILGHPGAGKTTTLLELAKELLAKATELESKRIPHIFELSRWEESMSIVEYLAIELERKPYYLDRDVGRGIAVSGQLLPLLDGLDELRNPKTISAAMVAINEYLKGSEQRDAVVCCRVLDYELASKKLGQLNAAIELQPLSESAIRNYLTAVGKGNLWALVEQNPALIQSDDPSILPLLKTPLFLSVFAEASPTVAVKSEGDLWDAYIVKWLGIPSEKLFGIGDKRYSKMEAPTQKQTKNYLIFSAQQLQQTQPEFRIQDINPDWLTTPSKRWKSKLLTVFFAALLLSLALATYLVMIEDGSPVLYKMNVPLFLLIALTITCQIKMIMDLKEDYTFDRFADLFFSLFDYKYIRHVFSFDGLLFMFLQMYIVVGAMGLLIFLIWTAPLLYPPILSLRITLYSSLQKPNDSQTRCIPWNYERFLSYAADRKLLQQTGGAYRFIHRSLLEHFAKMGETGSP